MTIEDVMHVVEILVLLAVCFFLVVEGVARIQEHRLERRLARLKFSELLGRDDNA